MGSLAFEGLGRKRRHGRRASNQVWSFETDNANAPYGVLRGIVSSDLDFSRIAKAKIVGAVGGIEKTIFAQVGGEYVLIMPPGTR